MEGPLERRGKNMKVKLEKLQNKIGQFESKFRRLKFEECERIMIS